MLILKKISLVLVYTLDIADRTSLSSKISSMNKSKKTNNKVNRNRKEKKRDLIEMYWNL